YFSRVVHASQRLDGQSSLWQTILSRAAGFRRRGFNNLLGNVDGWSISFGQGNIVGVDPQLGQLADNKGPTKTCALLANSAAIDAGDNSFSPGNTDQRGPGFPRIEGGTIDIGAFESKPIHAGAH